MALRKPINGDNQTILTSLEPIVDSTKEEEISTLATDPLPITHVNNANLGEIKAALDDIVKQHLESQSFTPSLLHPTVHLSLGYSSVILALSSVLYSLKVEFEDSKPMLWIAVVGYGILQSLLWAWKRWVEKGEVFKGKRRRMVKRIETDHIQIISSTSLSSPPTPQITFSPHTRPSSPNSVPTSPIPGLPSSSSSLSSSSPSTTLPSSLSPSSIQPTSSSPSSSSSSSGPSYNLQIQISITSNNGKSLIHKSKSIIGKLIGELIDQQGGIEKFEFIRWLKLNLNDSGLVGLDDSSLLTKDR